MSWVNLTVFFAKNHTHTFSPTLSLWGCRLLVKKEKNRGFPGGSVVKNPPVNVGDRGLFPGPQRSHMPQNNYWAWALKPGSCRYWSRRTLEPVLRNKRRQHSEKLVIVYSEQCQICDLRRFSFGTRDQAKLAWKDPEKASDIDNRKGRVPSPTPQPPPPPPPYPLHPHPPTHHSWS